jgi:hypothetical protein
VLFLWSLWVIVILPIEVQLITRIAIIFVIFVLINVVLIGLYRWVDNNKRKEQPTDKTLLIKPTPLVIRSLLINQPYSFGTILGGIKWSSDYRDLRIIFDNPTDDDYHDLDMIVSPDLHNMIIAGIGQISNLPNVTFHNPVMQAYLNQNGKPDVKFDKKTGNIYGARFQFVAPHKKVDGKTPLRVYPSYYRFRCDKLPRHMILELSLAIPTQDIAKQKGKINTVWVKGQYSGGGQTQNIDQNINLI